MAVTLRLSRKGLRSNPFYRIVAADKARFRDGKYLELIGTYNPMVEPPLVVLKEDRIKKWLEVGALPSSVVRDLIRAKIPGLIEGREKHQTEKILAARQARKKRAAARGKGAKKK